MYNNENDYRLQERKWLTIMEISEVTKDIHQLSIELEDMLFEGIWETPEGVTLNSYIVKGEKTALVDGVCGWDGVPESFFGLMEQLKIHVRDIDYLVINHMEPDHSGWIEQLREIRPDFKIVCTKASQLLLEAFYGYTENIMVVKDGDEVDLGNGKVLSFITMPNVHWPDTMVTYEKSTHTLFSCDVFGAFGAIENKRYDDQLTEDELMMLEEQGQRYYSNIIGPFTPFAIKGAKKLEDIELKYIAPGHGIVWRKNPQKIIDDYKRYMTYFESPNEDEVTIIFGSMYGMTEKAVTHIIKELEKYPVKVKVHRVPEDSWGTLLAAVWSSKNLIIAMPTYELKMFPPMAAAIEELAKKKVLNRRVFRLGSYGWSGGAQKEFDQIMEDNQLNWSMLEPLEFKGMASEEDYEVINQRIEALLTNK